MQPFMGLGNSLQTAQGGAATVGGWVELARTTLGSNGDDVTVSSLADKRYYMILTHITDSGQTNNKFRMGNSSIDTGSNYAYRNSVNGGADGPSTSTDSIHFTQDPADDDKFSVSYIANLSGQEKLLINNTVERGDNAGAANTPARTECVGKWVNTSNPLDIVSHVNTTTGDYTTGTECVVLGWDPADTHTTNFWEEIGTGTGTGIEDVTASASKKYNWIQGWVNPTSGSTSMNLRLGNGSLDSGSNYADRYSLNGAADVTDTSDDNCILYGTGASTSIHMFFNIFFINKSATEKLIMSHNVYYDTAGSAAAPIRFEIAGKWVNTSAQANHAGIVFSAGNAASNSELRWWGSD